jgi:hypothetical protein
MVYLSEIEVTQLQERVITLFNIVGELKIGFKELGEKLDKLANRPPV